MLGGDQEPGCCYVGVDVGTGSVRAALVDQRGVLLAFADQPIHKWEPEFNHHEQSSEDIWAACCVVTKEIPIETSSCGWTTEQSVRSTGSTKPSTVSCSTWGA
ncbi:FGGY carbohydrate kinase domain containing [Rhinolophus ferrumequinum]|uniref:FGGY carbohydrate kinase domain containing n=1 Tax=Rhinolophus ferrumequinum TaxID=59479 RepID=A0A7J7X549_RHIFE|nr:FGGY carbohydrate kinase domain containing [Rhinolophus ferrumequinum]